MDPSITVGVAVGLFTAVTFLLLFRKLVSTERLASIDAEWLNRYSVEKYRPMERLLSEEDYRFLKAHRSCDQRIIRKLRTERWGIFRAYLKCMRRDFSRLEAAARLYMVNSPEDRPDLAKALLKRRMTFTCRLAMVECGLVLHHFGLGTVDVRDLVGSMDSMHRHLGSLAMARQSVSI